MLRLLQLIAETDISGKVYIVVLVSADGIRMLYPALMMIRPRKTLEETGQGGQNRPTLFILLRNLHVGGPSTVPTPIRLVRSVITDRLRKVPEDKVLRNLSSPDI